MDRYHTAVIGDSGAGKSTLIREMHDNYPGLSVVVDDVDIGGISGRDLAEAETVDSASEARRSGASRLRWRCDDASDVIDDVREVLGEYHAATGYPTQIIVDEAHRHLPDSEAKSSASENTLSAMLHEDRDKGCKVVIATQDPQDLYYPPLKQCKYLVWCGPPSTFHRGFLRYYNLADVELPTRRFEYVTIRPTEPPEIVFRGETEERYA